METIIKQAIRFGNSAGVILPKDWRDKKVRVELIEDSLPKRIFEIIREEGFLSDVVGIYLVGSYARREETIESDVDVLVVTSKTNKELKKGQYEVLFISKEKLEKNLAKSLYLYSMVQEAKTILNNELINKYKGKKLRLPFEKKIKEISSVLKTNKEVAKSYEQINNSVIDGTAYSVVLRLRELFLIDCLLNNRPYSNKNFLKIIEKYNSKKSYEAYLRIKNDLKPKDNLNAGELLSLIKYSDNLIKKIKSEIGKKIKKT